MALTFNPDNFEVKELELMGRSIRFRAFEGMDYCEKPLDEIQKINIYVAEAFYEGKSINGYNLKSAPIYMPNTVGGYMPGPAMVPGADQFSGSPNSAFLALEHGYVVACAGIRGRTTGEVSDEFFVGSDALAGSNKGGKLVGRAPAIIVDMKAAIRYLRANKDLIPGDTEHIITNGTSAGGALSTLAGATGCSEDYESYLDAIGAAKERDDIFAVSAYCPIQNLENSDAAYEWMFHSEADFYMTNYRMGPNGVEIFVSHEVLTEKQKEISKELAAYFPTYLNSLNLKDEEGNALVLNADGEGSFKEYICSLIVDSANNELLTHQSRKKGPLTVKGSEVEKQSFIKFSDDGKALAIDFPEFVKAITRMKTCPAFDALDFNSPECEEFGDESVYARHFTDVAMKYSTVEGEKAFDDIIKLLNPVNYIGKAKTAPYWRIRHGAYDRDTALAIPTILALKLKNANYNVDYCLPWGLPHSGDYDMDEQFAWIDEICK